MRAIGLIVLMALAGCAGEDPLWEASSVPVPEDGLILVLPSDPYQAQDRVTESIVDGVVDSHVPDTDLTAIREERKTHAGVPAPVEPNSILDEVTTRAPEPSKSVDLLARGLGAAATVVPIPVCAVDADCAEGEACLVTPGEQKCGERLTVAEPVWRAVSL